jgi:hypothetical protein
MLPEMILWIENSQNQEKSPFLKEGRGSQEEFILGA